MSVCDHLDDASTDIALALNGVTMLDEIPDCLPDDMRHVLDIPLRSIRAAEPEAVPLLRQRLAILKAARQFGGRLKLENRIARTQAVLAHAEALAAMPTTEERHGDTLIRDDAETGQVVIMFAADLTRPMIRRIRSAGFFPKGCTAARPRKILDGENVALDAARRLVRGINGRLDVISYRDIVHV